VTAPAQPAARQLSTAQLIALVALIEAQARVRKQLSDAAVAAAVAAFSAITDWWDTDQIRKAAAVALKVVQPSQRQAARVTDAYMVRAVQIMTGRRVAPVGAVDVSRLRRAIPPRTARDLVDGRREPVFLILGENDPANRRVIAGKDMDTAAPMVIPDPNETPAQKLARQRDGQPAAVVENPAAAYGRIADAYRYQVIAKGTPAERVRAYALARVGVVAQTDVTLAVREQYRKSLQGLSKLTGVTGWRRILRPELSETGPCGLCVVAADRTYRIEDLKPIHNGCVCEVLPVIGPFDPGLTLNREDLNRIYDLAGGTGGDVIKDGQRHSGALQKIRVALAENGELGPILVDADQHYRGPVEVAKTVVPDQRVRKEHQLEQLDLSFASLTRRRQRGEDVEKPLAWTENRIRQLQRELAAL